MTAVDRLADHATVLARAATFVALAADAPEYLVPPSPAFAALAATLDGHVNRLEGQAELAAWDDKLSLLRTASAIFSMARDAETIARGVRLPPPAPEPGRAAGPIAPPTEE